MSVDNKELEIFIEAVPEAVIGAFAFSNANMTPEEQMNCPNPEKIPSTRWFMHTTMATDSSPEEIEKLYKVINQVLGGPNASR